MMDLDAARRQALGPHLTPARDDARAVADLQAGRLGLPPHPVWTLPQAPSWREDPFRDRGWQLRYHALSWLDPLRRADLHGDDDAAELWWYLARS